MNKTKIVRDSIHGYIEIDGDVAHYLVDTKYFQRLRRIEQTSMRCLYPAARHDRFIHSIGTYHLAKLAFSSFVKNISTIEICGENNYFLEIDYMGIGYNFEIASLLHDIGHSPFSHTLENYFKLEKVKRNKEKIPRIEYELFEEMEKVWKGNEELEIAFWSDYKSSSPSPHEIVSSIVLLRCLSENLEKLFHKKGFDINLEFIVRAIMGVLYTHSDSNSKKYCLHNCFIKLLNSSSIDVDKLDFITRDSQVFDGIKCNSKCCYVTKLFVYMDIFTS